MTDQAEPTTEDRADEAVTTSPADVAPTDDTAAAAETTDAPGTTDTADADADPADAADGEAAASGGVNPGHELIEEPAPDWDELAADDGRSPGQLLEALQETQGERDDYLDALQRSRAEFDNFRRRSAREAAGARAAGVGDLATQLLDVLDDLDRTVQNAETSSDEGLAAGITAVRRKLVDALVAAGVERIDAEGVPFDATRHEAVQKVDADEPLDEPEVAQVLRPGYLHGDRVLRAAMVSVRQ